MSRSLRAAAAAAVLTALAFPAVASATEALPSAAPGGPALPIALGLGALALGVGLLLAIVYRSAARPAVPESDTARPVVRSAESEGSDAHVGPGDAEEHETVRPPQPRRAKPGIVILGVVAAFVIGAVIAVGSASKPQSIDGKLTRTFGGEASACTSTSLALTPVGGADLATDGARLLDAFQGMEGVGTVTLDAQTSRIDVRFCESTTTEDDIKQALAGTGLVSF